VENKINYTKKASIIDAFFIGQQY